MRKAVNRFVVIRDDGLVTGLCTALDEDEARADMQKLGISGQLLTRDQYMQTAEGKAEKLAIRKAKVAAKVLARSAGADMASALEYMTDSNLTQEGLRLKRRKARRDTRLRWLEKATEEELDTYDPDTDADLDEGV